MKLRKITYGISLNLLVVAVVIGLGVGFSSPKRPELLVSDTAWVDDDDPTCGGNSPCFQTIQAAVEAVDDTIRAQVYIRPGRYRENVVLKRAVSLEGVGLARLEALDPEKPAILVSHGLGRGIDIESLEIVGMVEIVDAAIVWLLGNRIISISPFQDAGVWVERSKIRWITGNEISDARAGIFLGKGAVVGSIYNNSIRQTGWGIRLQDDAAVLSSIYANTFNNNGAHISATDQASAYIGGNQLLLGYSYGIEVLKDARVIIENNLISSNGMGIYISCDSLYYPLLGEDDPCPGLQGPEFTLIRNRIMGNRKGGLILIIGRGKVLRNWISENGSTHGPASSYGGSLLSGVGLLLGRRVQVEISHNWVVNNTLGVVYGTLNDDAYSDCQWSRENRPFEGKLTGSNNEIRDNEFADLCPSSGFPWPPGFRK